MSNKGGLLASVLIEYYIIDVAAIEDAENYDGGFLLERVIKAEKQLGIAQLKANLLLLAKYASDVWRYDDIDVTAARKLRDDILGEGK